MKRGILIDVRKREVREVVIGDDYTDIYVPLEADMFECVDIEEPNTIYVDEEGLLKLTATSMFFTYKGAHQPFAGNGFILGVDYETGDSIDTTLTVEEVKQKVGFHTLQEVRMMKG